MPNNHNENENCVMFVCQAVFISSDLFGERTSFFIAVSSRSVLLAVLFSMCGCAHSFLAVSTRVFRGLERANFMATMHLPFAAQRFRHHVITVSRRIGSYGGVSMQC